MKIIRDGKEIELTREEMRTAYEELDANYKRDDILECLREYDLEADDDTIDQILACFQKAIFHSDDYFESYWSIADYAIREIMGVVV